MFIIIVLTLVDLKIKKPICVCLMLERNIGLFHLKVITRRDGRLSVNVRTALSIVLANTHCEGFPLHKFLSFIL